MDSNSNECDADNANESERNEIRSELAKMSFEDLIKLKEKLGLKVYKEAVSDGKNALKKVKFKRENKNRPREVSSKIKPDFRPKKVKESKIITDPRFNRLCGTFNKKHFDNTYEFLTEIKNKEKKQLKEMLKNETDERKINKLKYLIQRMNNQELEEIKRQKKQEREEQERLEQIKSLESGKKPHFKTKYERKIVDLVDKYAALKKTGKVENYIKKKQKKVQMMERKTKRYFEVNIDDNS